MTTRSLMMRLITASLCALLFLVLTAALPANSAGVNDQVEPAPALWKLTDADSEVYLFGTIHILNPNIKWRSKAVISAFNSAPVVYFETPADPQAMQALIPKYAINKPGVTLSSQLSAEAQQNLNTVLAKFGMGGAAKNLENLRPWFAGVMLAGVQIQANGGDANAGVERILSADAKAMGKTIRYFERDEQQLQFFGNMSPAAESRFFEVGIEQMLEDPDMLSKLVTLWRSGDVEGVDRNMLTAFEGQQEVYETILVRRNEDWAKQIDTLMDGSGTAFIAVGAAHLAGAQSVQAMLKKYGHQAVRQ